MDRRTNGQVILPASLEGRHKKQKPVLGGQIN